MTATLRRIDLSCKVLSPVGTGVIMTYAGVETGALVIGGWNLISVFVEYYFLWKVYNTVPALVKQKGMKKSECKLMCEFLLLLLFSFNSVLIVVQWFKSLNLDR